MLRRSIFAFLIVLLVVSLPHFHFEAYGQPELPGPFPGLGAYSNFIKVGCGEQGLTGARWNPKELPLIGCFGLSSGSSVIGTVADHQLEIAVDANGHESCKVNGITVVRTVRSRTNVPNVLWGCENLSFCVNDNWLDCSTTFSVISRNSDKSIFFQISQRIFGHTFVTNQENWDDFQRRKQRCPESKPYC
jgi:hypothetical protein